MRLNAYLARTGVSSRRGADALIKAGRVKVNGQRGQLNMEVGEKDKVSLDDRPIISQPLRYILLNKPAYTITTLKDEQNRPTVAGMIDISERIVPVGRLDTNTTGALLLTNDGELAHKLMHPSFEVDKVYIAEIEGKVSPEILDKLSNGVEIDGSVTVPAAARKLADGKIELTIHEGRKHQVKLMFAAVGLKVKMLHRAKYGPLTLGDLKQGKWRELSDEEIAELKSL